MHSSEYELTIGNIVAVLEQQAIPYQFVGETALFLQDVLSEPVEVTVEVQWDLLEIIHETLLPYSPTSIEKTKDQGSFHFNMEKVPINVQCNYNKALRTDPYRIQIEMNGQHLWCQSLYEILDDHRYEALINSHLFELQMQMTEQNQAAWNQDNFQALINRHGEPGDVAAKIKQNPEGRLSTSFYRHMKPVEGKRIAHLMGSNGIKAVALSLLGADVTVVDFSKENAAFAGAVAEQADIDIHYVVSDVLSYTDKREDHAFDFVLMELGVLHYYISLDPLVQVINRLLKPGGTLVLHEFHPISTKLITSKGKKHKVSGNYFDPTIENREVAFSKYSADGEKEMMKVLQRKWTLGELITAVAKTDLIVKVLDEEPNQKVHDIGLPKLFTLVAQKPE
ncbi:bifunctional 2-polyprenyl-6-hydroxyphenol methylase/3-demethylubiquinol 3-O-methyltransferase UbiG [Alkalihalobacillus sp. TS-13]|uniref:class I SAM-dependent methyltransferase n=1 Tax=Alkalihalobacillus sp. TS-13 TaxID=2842455 RepID=UPI0021AAD3A7|nr:class I SAM-dependent methyltransferase [Alkalihalobacillus sp. TS-13]